MSATPEGRVSMSQLAERTGISIHTAYKYARELGMDSSVPAEDAAEAEAAFRNLMAKYAERHLIQRRKGMHASSTGILTCREIGEAAGCSRDSAWYILCKRGWPSEIPPERLHDAVAAVRAELEKRDARYERRGRPHVQKKAAPRVADKRAVKKSKPCDWRVSMLGKKGWLVVRCGTQCEMEAWARMLRDNGFVAEAAENMYRSEVK